MEQQQIEKGNVEGSAPELKEEPKISLAPDESINLAPASGFFPEQELVNNNQVEIGKDEIFDVVNNERNEGLNGTAELRPMSGLRLDDSLGMLDNQD